MLEFKLSFVLFFHVLLQVSNIGTGAVIPESAKLSSSFGSDPSWKDQSVQCEAIATFQRETALQCAMQCVQILSCLSFNFCSHTPSCELCNATLEDDGYQLVAAPGCSYWQIDNNLSEIPPETTSTVQATVESCDATAHCNSRGDCTVVGSSNVCNCHTNWTGSKCQSQLGNPDSEEDD
ncbi:uncharacterized protein LOC144439108 [Glandiceps talaboti]